jgi:hypothetical protein
MQVNHFLQLEAKWKGRRKKEGCVRREEKREFMGTIGNSE